MCWGDLRLPIPFLDCFPSEAVFDTAFDAVTRPSPFTGFGALFLPERVIEGIPFSLLFAMGAVLRSVRLVMGTVWDGSVPGDCAVKVLDHFTLTRLFNRRSDSFGFYGFLLRGGIHVRNLFNLRHLGR